jgi:hypothetical protein
MDCLDTDQQGGVARVLRPGGCFARYTAIGAVVIAMAAVKPDNALAQEH